MPSVLASPLLAGGLVLASRALAASETCGGEELTSLLQGGLRSVSRHEADSADRAAGLPEYTVACGQSDFVKYPGYDGDLAVTGHVHVAAVKGQTPAKHRQVLTYHVSGVDPACDHGPGGDDPNSCGIHIHEGTTCEDKDLVLGHYWNASLVKKDPWGCVAYTAEQKSETGPWEACSLGVSAKTGIPPEDVPGRAVVVYNYEGVPVACATLPVPTKPATTTPAPSEPDSVDKGFKLVVTADTFTKYDSYDGAVADVYISGKVVISRTTGHCPRTPGQYLTYHLSGLDPACSMGPGPDANSCGIYVDAGTSCDNALGPYWNSNATDPQSRKRDPWHCTAYTACEEGKAADMLVEVTTGESFWSIAGKTLMVHDYEGKPMACALIH